MLLSLQRIPLTAPPRHQRLLCLERHVRNKSDGRYKIQDYREWLEQDGITIPKSRQALHDDFSFYATFCDDIDYGSHSKWLRLNSSVDEDAVAWFMGTSWANSPVRPRLSSSVARCLLMGLKGQREVSFLYAKREQMGHGVARAETWRVIPHHVVPGLDSAYMGMWLHSGKIATFNLARIVGRVNQTGEGNHAYAPAEYSDAKTYRIEHPDAMLLTKLHTQFFGFKRIGPHILETRLRPDEQYFLESMLPNWAIRTSPQITGSTGERFTGAIIQDHEVQ